MNFYTLASKMKKMRLHAMKEALDCGKDWEQAKLHSETEMMREFDSTCALGITLMERFKSQIPERQNGYYMVTIRPDDKLIKFDDFKILVDKFVIKKFILYSYSFEQKSTHPEGLGQGFHVHIIGQAKAAKARLLTQACNYFADCTASNCIQIDLCKHPSEAIKSYLLDYKSDDGHKEKTRECDELWRDKKRLAPLYTNTNNYLSDIGGA